MLKNLVSSFRVVVPLCQPNQSVSVEERKESIISNILHTVPFLDESRRGEIQSILTSREAKGSTGLGRGVALPHGRTQSIEKPLIVLGIAPDGIDWDSQDGEPVYLVFLVLVPLEQSDLYLRIVTRLSALVRENGFVDALVKCSTSDEALNLIHEYELNQKLKKIIC